MRIAVLFFPVCISQGRLNAILYGPKSIFGHVVESARNFVEEIKYRKYNFDQYQKSVRYDIDFLYEKFLSDQSAATALAKNDMANSLSKLRRKYDENLKALQERIKQVDILNLELAAERIKRASKLEDPFESLHSPFYTPPESKRSFFGLFRRKNTPARKKESSFMSKLEQLNTNVRRQVNSALEYLKSENAGILPIDDSKLTAEISRLQEELRASARQVLTASQTALQQTFTELEAPASLRDFRKLSRKVQRERALINAKLVNLEKKRVEWVTQRQQEMEALLRSLQEKVSLTDSAYEELLAKKNQAAFYT